jgi:hypothetical protein
MTALMFIYTTEGFLVAADGIKKRSDGVVIDTSAQKIFPVGEPGTATVAYGLAGNVQLANNDGQVLFDFITETGRATSTIPMSGHTNLAAYMTAISGAVNMSLQNSIRAEPELTLPPTVGKQLPDGNPDIIAWAFFCGYFGRNPEYGCIRFVHQSQELMVPEIQPFPITLGEPTGYLSEAIASGLFRPSHPNYNRAMFRLHRAVSKAPAHALTDALGVAASYFAACEHPPIRTLDERHCADVGGTIRAATITPSQKFQWIPEPEVLAALTRFDTIEF